MCLRVLAMSVMGQERTSAVLDFMSALPPKADVKREKADIGDFMSVSHPITDIPNRPANVR